VCQAWRPNRDECVCWRRRVLSWTRASRWARFTINHPALLFFVFFFWILHTYNSHHKSWAHGGIITPAPQVPACGQKTKCCIEGENPPAAGIRRFFSLEQRVEKKDIGPRRSRSRRCPPPVVVVVVVGNSLFHHLFLRQDDPARNERVLWRGWVLLLIISFFSSWPSVVWGSGYHPRDERCPGLTPGQPSSFLLQAQRLSARWTHVLRGPSSTTRWTWPRFYSWSSSPPHSRPHSRWRCPFARHICSYDTPPNESTLWVVVSTSYIYMTLYGIAIHSLVFALFRAAACAAPCEPACCCDTPPNESTLWVVVSMLSLFTFYGFYFFVLFTFCLFYFVLYYVVFILVCAAAGVATLCGWPALAIRHRASLFCE